MKIKITRPNPISVLTIENNDVDCRLLKSMLLEQSDGKFDLKFAATMDDAHRSSKKNGFDVILLDLNLPDSKGLDTLHTVNRIFPNSAIVINTGAYEDDLGLQALSCGAQDYLIKGKYTAYGISKAIYYAVERKRVELELKTAYNSLKETQAQLIQIEKMNVVGSLASGIAHEVKNPLAAILYGVEYLGQKIKTDDEKIQLSINTIKDSAQKANDIIKDLLDFANSSKLYKRQEDINSILEKSVQLLKVIMDKHCVKLSREYGPIPTIEIDGNRIEQVIVDLLMNAVNAVPPTGGELIIRSYSRKLLKGDRKVIDRPDSKLKAGDPVIVIEIDDTGCGIDEELQEKIFDPFFTTRRSTGGAGLGLFVSRSIVKNHGGEITIQNRKEGGARAQVFLKV